MGKTLALLKSLRKSLIEFIKINWKSLFVAIFMIFIAYELMQINQNVSSMQSDIRSIEYDVSSMQSDVSSIEINTN